MRLIVSIALGLLLAACDSVSNAAKSIESALFEEPAYEIVEGEDAAPFLQEVAGTGPFDPAALSQAMSVAEGEASKETLTLLGLTLAAEDDEIPEVSGATIDFFAAGADQKAALKSDSFEQPELSSLFGPPAGAGLVADYDPANDTVSLDDASWGGKSELLISTAGRVSVKDQGQRGTCAAHAGIGQLEYLIMKKHGAELAAVDLSEQRLYMLSRQDLWDKGGGTTDEDGGSNWARGFALSYGQDGQLPPTDTPPYNIPAEFDCPYVNVGGANELQIPQAASCLTGSVRVSNLTETSYVYDDAAGEWIEQSTSPKTAQQIFDFLKKYDLPVPVGTVLTENWMDNDGFITFAKSQEPGYGPHAGGHAYLIVGARKLDETKFPGEGGMCFIIKNSWGSGWGLNGYSCMTLKWFNTYRQPYASDVALDVELDLDHLKALAGGSTTPPPPAEPSATEQEPAVVASDDPGPPAGGEPATGDGGASAPTPAPSTDSDGFRIGRLLAKNGRTVQIGFKTVGETLLLRSIHAGGKGYTSNLELGLSGDKIVFDDDKHARKAVVGGELHDDLVILCAGRYAQICHLNYVAADNRLVVGLTETEFRNYEPDTDASYESLVNLANYGIEYHLGDGVFADFRFIIKGQPTNPIRLAVKPISGDIVYRGQQIGNYQSLEFCSGSFASVCRVLMNTDERSIKIFFKAKKNI